MTGPKFEAVAFSSWSCFELHQSPAKAPPSCDGASSITRWKTVRAVPRYLARSQPVERSEARMRASVIHVMSSKKVSPYDAVNHPPNSFSLPSMILGTHLLNSVPCERSTPSRTASIAWALIQYDVALDRSSPAGSSQNVSSMSFRACVADVPALAAALVVPRSLPPSAAEQAGRRDAPRAKPRTRKGERMRPLQHAVCHPQAPWFAGVSGRSRRSGGRSSRS